MINLFCNDLNCEICNALKEIVDYCRRIDKKREKIEKFLNDN